MTAIECGADRVTLVVQTSSGAVRLWSEALDRIDFVSFRADYSGSVNCGPQAYPAPMLFTYRPEREGTIIGEVLIVEVVPRGYKPKVP
jgi:hypothetical protein